MKVLNCIVFGLGDIAKIHINNILNQKDKFNILYIITNKGENYLNIPIIKPDKYYNRIYNENKNDKKIDCAFICSPTRFHYTQTMDCLDNSINVFVEKPLSNKIKEINNIYNMAKKRNVKVLLHLIEDLTLHKKII